MIECKINMKDIIDEKEIATLSTKQLWHKKREYCLTVCGKCDQLKILKKIYWELRKPNTK